MLHRQSGWPTDFEAWIGMKPGYLALYSYKYKAEKSVNYVCINLNRGGSFVSSFHCTVHWYTMVYYTLLPGIIYQAIRNPIRLPVCSQVTRRNSIRDNGLWDNGHSWGLSLRQSTHVFAEGAVTVIDTEHLFWQHVWQTQLALRPPQFGIAPAHIIPTF